MDECWRRTSLRRFQVSMFFIFFHKTGRCEPESPSIWNGTFFIIFCHPVISSDRYSGSLHHCFKHMICTCVWLEEPMEEINMGWFLSLLPSTQSPITHYSINIPLLFHYHRLGIHSDRFYCVPCACSYFS